MNSILNEIKNQMTLNNNEMVFSFLHYNFMQLSVILTVQKQRKSKGNIEECDYDIYETSI